MTKSRKTNFVTNKFALEKRSGRGGSYSNQRPSTTRNNDNNSTIIFSLNEGVGIDDKTLLENPPYKIYFPSIEKLIAPSTTSRPFNKSKKNPGKKYTPRPQNDFMLFRKNFNKGFKNKKKSDRAAKKISAEAQKEWDNASPEVKLYFKKLAELAANLHKEKYPDYSYTPKRKNEKNINSNNNNGNDDDDDDDNNNDDNNDNNNNIINSNSNNDNNNNDDDVNNNRNNNDNNDNNNEFDEMNYFTEQLYQLYQQQIYENLCLQQFQEALNMLDQSQQHPQLQYSQLQYTQDVMITTPGECSVPNLAVESSPASTNLSELESPEIEYCQYSSIYDFQLFPEIELSRSLFDNYESKH